MSGFAYTESAPDPRLSEHVECYWASGVRGGDSRRHAVLPDGCIDLLFDTGREELHVIGTMSTALWAEHRGPVQFVGVRFKPGGAVPFLGERADLFTDRRVSSGAVLGRAGRELGDRLAEAATAGLRLRALEQALLRRLPETRPVDPRIGWATGQLRRNPAHRVAELARELSLSRQQVRRLFLQHTGVSAKTYARVARLRGLVPALSRGSLCEAALAAGYADQAHMTHEFRQLVGATPTAYLAGL